MGKTDYQYKFCPVTFSPMDIFPVHQPPNTAWKLPPTSLSDNSHTILVHPVPTQAPCPPQQPSPHARRSLRQAAHSLQTQHALSYCRYLSLLPRTSSPSVPQSSSHRPRPALPDIQSGDQPVLRHRRYILTGYTGHTTAPAPAPLSGNPPAAHLPNIRGTIFLPVPV